MKHWSCQLNIKSWSNRRINLNRRIDLTVRIDSTNILIWSSNFIESSPRTISNFKNFHSFKLIIFNIGTVSFCPTHSIGCNFRNTMTRRKPIGVIRQPSNSGSGADDRLEFICFVGGREPQIHELWIFAEDGITREVHPFARIDVGNFRGDCFRTTYTTEIGRRVSIYGRKLINGSVEWLGVPAPSCSTGVTWTENILVPDSR